MQFATWVQDVIRSIEDHKNRDATKEARARSGSAYGQHGLTDRQVQDRSERDKARRDYWWTMTLQGQLQAGKGKGKGKGVASEHDSGKGACKSKGGAPQHAPKQWDEFSWNEQWWLRELWNGNLRARVQAAERRCGGRVQAEQFYMVERL